MTGEIEVPAEPPVSVVVRAFNEAQHIPRLLRGIRQQSLRCVEVILVDSGSTDDTVAAAGRAWDQPPAPAYPLRVVHIQPDEFTFGRSLNRGLAAAQAELIVIASAHVYPVYPDWLERLLAPFQESGTGLVYGKQRGASHTHFSEHQIFARWYPDASISRQSHPFCNNANAAIRRKLWEQRPYDESLSGLEDLDWARWAMEQGHAISYAAEAEVVHVHQEDPRSVYNRYRREAMAFKRIFPQEHFHFWDFLRLFASNAASDLLHAAGVAPSLRLVWSILWFRWMQFWGTYQGYRQSGPLTWQLRQTFYYPRGVPAPSQDIGSEPEARQVEPIHYQDAG